MNAAASRVAWKSVAAAARRKGHLMAAIAKLHVARDVAAERAAINTLKAATTPELKAHRSESLAV